MLGTLLLISFLFIQTNCDELIPSKADFIADEMLELLKTTIEAKDSRFLMTIVHPNITFKLCDKHGNYDDFQMFLDDNLPQIKEAKIEFKPNHSMIKSARNSNQLQFQFELKLLFSSQDRSVVSFSVVAVKNQNDAIYRLIEVTSRCTFIDQPRRRLYRLFTYTDLYDD